jgi:hypothetical protein
MWHTSKMTRSPSLLSAPEVPPQRAVACLVKAGIPRLRVSILNKGIRGWPATEMLQNTVGQ